jgi:Uma2 family endonuclease
LKAPLYARHGIPELWIVDLQNMSLWTYRSPADGRYRDENSTKEPGMMPIAALPTVEVDLSGLFRA